MSLKLVIDEEVRDRFPDLNVLLMELDSVKVLEYSEELERFKSEIYDKLRKRYKLESLKDDPLVKTYRNFFWRIGIDPTKIRPAAEALLRRILSGRGIPRINTLVDSYNLASAESGIALAAFDSEKIDGDMIMRFAKEGGISRNRHEKTEDLKGWRDSCSRLKQTRRHLSISRR